MSFGRESLTLLVYCPPLCAIVCSTIVNGLPYFTPKIEKEPSQMKQSYSALSKRAERLKKFLPGLLGHDPSL